MVIVCANGLVVIQSQNGQKNEVQIGTICLCADICQNELAVGTDKGIVLINLQMGQMMQTAPFYTAPVGCLRYYTSDFMLACFVDMMNGNVNTVQPCSNTMNRWS